MGTFFGESDTIDFGENTFSHQTSSTKVKKALYQKEPVSMGCQSKIPVDPAPKMETLCIDEALVNLVSTMKPSFLPKMETPPSCQCIALSKSCCTDPLFLFSTEDTSVLIGTGVGTIEKAGNTYTTFPDMRLPFSEKANIRAWIFLDKNMQIEPMLPLLSLLNFPHIYATRDIIAKFRDSIKDTKYAQKCRFFEILSPELSLRTIGNIECGRAQESEGTYFALRALGQTLVYRHLPLTGEATLSGGKSLSLTPKGFLLDDAPFEMGDILLFFSKKKHQKHPLHFTFDSFYFDGNSIGIETGYTIQDREVLGKSGVLLFTLQEDPRLRTIMGHIFIESRGFIHSYEVLSIHKEILKAIRMTYESLISQNPMIERGDLAQRLRKEITKYCMVLTGRTPIVMPIIL